MFALALAAVLAPAVAIVLIGITRRARLAEFLNLAAAVVSFAVSVPLVVLLAHTGARVFVDQAVLIDPLEAWVQLCTTLVYLLASIYAVGYMRHIGEDDELPLFYALFAGFGLTMLIAPMMNKPGLYWIAIEATTLVSTFCVCFERAAESIEAAWKYIIVVSAGLSLALLGTALFYWNGTFVLGQRYVMTWATLAHIAPHLHPNLAILAFLLVLVGFGTKVGLAPMHTWLPDAHSEGPAPVSAMLSGALLNTAMVGIVRYLAIADAAGIGAISHAFLIALGAFSLFVAALFIVRQDGVKRLMAYSTVEHMGVIALGFGFGGPFGVAGALYQMLNHSAAKSLMFFGAGNAMRSYGTKKMREIFRFSEHFPVTGALWLAGAVAITGAPPFGLFQSEFSILRAGFAVGNIAPVLIMLVLLIVIFVGFINHFRVMFYEKPRAIAERRLTQPAAWCVVPMALALAPVVVLGFWWPERIWHFFGAVAETLGGA
ncbi:MAG: proton-conducting transporter membrane subunit [Acetobacteraceae bacterium]